MLSYARLEALVRENEKAGNPCEGIRPLRSDLAAVGTHVSEIWASVRKIWKRNSGARVGGCLVLLMATLLTRMPKKKPARSTWDTDFVLSSEECFKFPERVLQISHFTQT